MDEEELAEEVEMLQTMFLEGEMEVLSDRSFLFTVTPEDTDADDPDRPRKLLTVVTWPESYPDVPAAFDFDRNKDMSSDAKAKAQAVVDREVDDLLGTPMTFNLVTALKEAFDEFMPVEDLTSLWESVSKKEKVKPGAEAGAGGDASAGAGAGAGAGSGKKAGKDHRTKAQKRRQGAHLNAQGVLPRGHDWVDLVSHLKRSGPKASS